MEFAEEEESDREEGTRHPYKKHQWTLLEAWSNIKIKEVYRRAAKSVD